jgi:hypothetical protein
LPRKHPQSGSPLKLAHHIGVKADGLQVIGNRNALIDAVNILDGVRVHAHRQEAVNIG